MYWKGLTTKGAVAGGIVGLVTAIMLMVLGPAGWVDVFGKNQPIFPQAYPALYSVTLAFITMWAVSVMDSSEQGVQDRNNFQVMEDS